MKRLLKYVRTQFGFIERKVEVFEKPDFFKIGKGGKFAVECLSNDNISWKCLFHLNCEFFCKQSENLQDIQNLMEEEYFL